MIAYTIIHNTDTSVTIHTTNSYTIIHAYYITVLNVELLIRCITVELHF